MAKAQAERESRRRQREQVADEKNILIAHVELLKRFVSLLGFTMTHLSGDRQDTVDINISCFVF